MPLFAIDIFAAILGFYLKKSAYAVLICYQ